MVCSTSIRTNSHPMENRAFFYRLSRQRFMGMQEVMPKARLLRAAVNKQSVVVENNIGDFIRAVATQFIAHLGRTAGETRSTTRSKPCDYLGAVSFLFRWKIVPLWR